MTAPTHIEHSAPLEPTELRAVLVADLTLRFGAARLRAHVHWPLATVPAGSPLILLLADAHDAWGADGSHVFGDRLCSAAAAVVLAVPALAATRSVDAQGPDCWLAALGWAAEHTGELGANPDRLVVAGCYTDAAHAAWLAIRARDDGWPQLSRQLLVHPTFSTANPIPSRLEALAPTTIVTGAAPEDDGVRYAALLRASGIEVEELRQPIGCLPRDELLVSLARSLRPPATDIDPKKSRRTAPMALARVRSTREELR